MRKIFSLRGIVSGLVMSSMAVAASYSGGDGLSEATAYRIGSVADLQTLMATPDDWIGRFFVLTTDLDLSDMTFDRALIAPDTDAADGGFQGTPFTGFFDGAGHTIHHLTISTNDHFAGLFGFVESGAEIKNLTLDQVDIRGGYYVGGLVAYFYDGTLRACHVTGVVTGMGDIGGLTGLNFFGTIDACHAVCLITGLSSQVGGLVGLNYDGIVQFCYAAGDTFGNGTYVGGLIGKNDGLLTSCYATGTVGSNYYYVGGLAGENWGLIDSCYAACSIYGEGSLGGLVGSMYYGVDAVISASFWDTQVSGLGNGIGDIADTDGVKGKTTAQMKIQATFADAGWDLVGETANGTNDVWRMCAEDAGYPRLNWQALAGDFACPDGVAMDDLDYFSRQWLRSDCTSGNRFCGGADMDTSGAVNLADLAFFAGLWLTGD